MVRKKNKKATTYHEKLIKVFDECLVPRRGDFNLFDYIGKVGTILEIYTIHLKIPKACHAFLLQPILYVTRLPAREHDLDQVHP